jgi:lipopolysaccharide export system protein LptA
MRRLLKTLLLLTSLLPLAVVSMPEDSLQTMHIVADTTLFNYKTGINTYEGHVEVTQGGTRLTAERLVTKNNKTHKMEEAIAYGAKKPADYWTIPKKDDPLFHAQANVIKFYPLKSLVFLEGKVVVTQGDNNFHGALIIYNMKNQTISSPANNQGRSTIVIQPLKTSI